MADNQAKSKMTDEERTELMKKMDKELEEHFRKLEERAAAGGLNRESMLTEENWEEQLASHPFFSQSWKEGEELSPLMKGLQDLKYSPDENTPDELARNYKEDGNFNFKCKKYRFAIASYTEGLRAGSTDPLINTQLYTNRAASQYHIGNYRSSLKDCEAALKLSPDHMKALVRAAQCYVGLRLYDSAIVYCDKGILLDPKQPELLKLRGDAVKTLKEKERDERKRAAAEKKKKAEDNKLLDAIKSRGIDVEAKKGDFFDLSDLEPCHPAAVHKRVHFDAETGCLVFPVLFVYPEFGEMDLIEEFREQETLADHVQVMFGGDSDGPLSRYKPDTVVLYFEDKNGKLQLIPLDYTLVQVLTMKGFLLKAGTPAFICFVRSSPAHLEFLKRHNE